MSEYARVENGQIVELREIDDMPPHKANLWHTVERSGSGPQLSIEIDGNVVKIVRSAAAITVEDVIAERKRRLALGFNYDFGDARGVHTIGATDDDMNGWSEVSTYAGALIDAGQTSASIAIATNTGTCTVTPIEWRAIEIASAAFRQPLWAASFALMAMNPIPASFADDSYWTP